MDIVTYAKLLEIAKETTGSSLNSAFQIGANNTDGTTLTINGKGKLETLSSGPYSANTGVWVDGVYRSLGGTGLYIVNLMFNSSLVIKSSHSADYFGEGRITYRLL